MYQINSSQVQYAYDYAGRRIKRTVGSDTTYYFYGLTGLMSEFSTASGASGAAASDRLQYRVGEQTGTAVMLVDAGGTPRENNRVFPFGEPWLQFAGSTNTEKFTTYQHDNDDGTDLDYAMARYYASRSGRFMTPDPGHIGAFLGDPQSWNAYAYGRNDPINLVDPSGMKYLVCGWNDGCAQGQELTDTEFETLVVQGQYTIDGSTLTYFGDPSFFFYRTGIDGSDGPTASNGEVALGYIDTVSKVIEKRHRERGFSQQCLATVQSMGTTMDAIVDQLRKRQWSDGTDSDFPVAALTPMFAGAGLVLGSFFNTPSPSVGRWMGAFTGIGALAQTPGNRVFFRPSSILNRGVSSLSALLVHETAHNLTGSLDRALQGRLNEAKTWGSNTGNISSRIRRDCF